MPLECLRRQFIVGSLSGATMLAGCRQPGQSRQSSQSTSETESKRADSSSERTVTTETDDETETTIDGTATQEPDLREANVVAVETESIDDDAYRFDVTLYHDDDGEDGYADWWQVETVEGEQLGRRELLHAHSTAPFTRSETIEIPSGSTCVVVRGHDQTHEYGGQAMVVTLETGTTRTVRQGSGRTSLSDVDCSL
jgi:hypothetical protein